MEVYLKTGQIAKVGGADVAAWAQISRGGFGNRASNTVLQCKKDDRILAEFDEDAVSGFQISDEAGTATS